MLKETIEYYNNNRLRMISYFDENDKYTKIVKTYFNNENNSLWVERSIKNNVFYGVVKIFSNNKNLEFLRIRKNDILNGVNIEFNY